MLGLSGTSLFGGAEAEACTYIYMYIHIYIYTRLKLICYQKVVAGSLTTSATIKNWQVFRLPVDLCSVATQGQMCRAKPAATDKIAGNDSQANATSPCRSCAL